MTYKYSKKDYNKEHMARVVGVALPISTKSSIEICNKLRKMSVTKAKALLKEVMKNKVAIEFKRFTNGAGHKGGVGPGKYPMNASKEILRLLDAVEANAQFKGLNTAELIIEHISAQRGGNQWRYGRHRRRKMKRTHLELVVREGEKKTKKAIEGKKTTVEKPVKKVEEKKKKVDEKNPEEKVVKKEETKQDIKKEHTEKKIKAEKVPTAAELAAKNKPKEVKE